MLKKMLKQRNKKGFTLIELIVVLVILAILAAAAIPMMMGYVEKARKSTYLANCRVIYVAAQAGLTEATANGMAATISNTDGAINGNGTKLSQRITEMVGTDFTMNLVTTTPVAKDTYQVVITGGKIEKIICCYNDKKATLTLTTGVGADSLDYTTPSTP